MALFRSVTHKFPSANAAVQLVVDGVGAPQITQICGRFKGKVLDLNRNAAKMKSKHNCFWCKEKETTKYSLPHGLLKFNSFAAY